MRLRSDVPLGAFLSGGVDSSTVVALMRREGVEQLSTFSIGFEEDAFNELPYANHVARHFKTDHHTRVVTSADAAVVPALLEHFDEPFADSSALPTYFVSELAREHVTVALSGDGGDELFGGYGHYCGLRAYEYLSLLPPRVVRSAGDIAGRMLPENRRGSGLARRMQTEGSLRHLAYMAPPIPSVLVEALTPSFRAFLWDEGDSQHVVGLLSNDGSTAEALVGDQRTYLPDDILTKVDRMSMRVSLEARIPLLDHPLAEYVNALPLSHKVGLGEQKTVLRRAVRGLLPSEVLERRKQGFGVPLRQWLRGPLAPWVHEVLSDMTPALLDPAGIRRLLIGMDAAHRDFTPFLWRLLALGVWSRRQTWSWS